MLLPSAFFYASTSSPRSHTRMASQVSRASTKISTATDITGEKKNFPRMTPRNFSFFLDFELLSRVFPSKLDSTS